MALVHHKELPIPLGLTYAVGKELETAAYRYLTPSQQLIHTVSELIRIPKNSVILEAITAMVKVKVQYTDVELWQAYQASTCAVERRRLHVLALLAGGLDLHL